MAAWVAARQVGRNKAPCVLPEQHPQRLPLRGRAAVWCYVGPSGITSALSQDDTPTLSRVRKDPFRVVFEIARRGAPAFSLASGCAGGYPATVPVALWREDERGTKSGARSVQYTGI